MLNYLRENRKRGIVPHTLHNNILYFTTTEHFIEEVIIKKLKGKTLIEILFKIGFRRKEKGLRVLYLINRKGISKIGVCVAKKKIRGSVERSVIKRRIRAAYKNYRKKIDLLQINYYIFFFWNTKKTPSSNKLRILMKKLLHINWIVSSLR